MADNYHNKTGSASQRTSSVSFDRIANTSPKLDTNKGLWLALFILTVMQVYTCFRLIEARHEARNLRSDIQALGDELDTIEARTGIDREAIQS